MQNVVLVQERDRFLITRPISLIVDLRRGLFGHLNYTRLRRRELVFLSKEDFMRSQFFLIFIALVFYYSYSFYRIMCSIFPRG